MSRETSEWLNRNILIGFTDKRGKAWHYRASDQGDEPNHYPGPIPAADVERRLFYWTPVVGEVAVTYLSADGVTHKTDDKAKAIVRPDTGDIFVYAGRDYEIHHYSDWLLNALGAILDDGDLEIGSAGLLQGGARAWVQVEVPDTCTTPEGVAFRPFLSAATSLDQSLSTTYVRGTQLVVCDNTLSAALTQSGASVLRYRHRKGSRLRVLEAREALEIVHRVAEDFAAQVRELCHTTVTEKQWSRFLDAYIPVPDEPGPARTRADRKRSEFTQLWTNDERSAPWRGTAWGVVQVANTHAHHFATVRGASRAERNMERSITGKADNLDQHTIAVLNRVLDSALVG